MRKKYMFHGTQKHCAVSHWIKLASHLAELVNRKESVSIVGIPGHKMQSWLCLSSLITLQHVGDPPLAEVQTPRFWALQGRSSLSIPCSQTCPVMLIPHSQPGMRYLRPLSARVPPLWILSSREVVVEFHVVNEDCWLGGTGWPTGLSSCPPCDLSRLWLSSSRLPHSFSPIWTKALFDYLISHGCTIGIKEFVFTWEHLN